MIDGVRTISDIAQALRDGSTTSLELCRAVLERIEKLDPHLGCFLARFDGSALAAAEAADAAFRAGIDRGPLQGVPFGIKDLLSTTEGPTTAQSLILRGQQAQSEDAAVVARLRNHGAVILGKVALSEFACGSPDPSSGFPVPRNPWSHEHWPGGSSSGTALGVAADMFPGGIGTDTGGSIRIPAALCGITGLKPTYGRVSKRGCIPFAYSMDAIGPMAHTARDCALILQVVAGPDPGDGTTIDITVPHYEAALDGSVKGLRIGIERRHHQGIPGLDRRVVDCIETAVQELENAGASVDEVVFPHYQEAVAVAHVTTAGEAFAYHHDDLRERWLDYGRTTRAILAQGALYHAGDYVNAQRVRALVRREAAALFRACDVLITPTVGFVAPRLEEDFMRGVMPLLFTMAWNAVGFPAASIPAGFVDGLPVGMQIIGRPFDEETILRVADTYQRVTDWHLRKNGELTKTGG